MLSSSFWSSRLPCVALPSSVDSPPVGSGPTNPRSISIRQASSSAFVRVLEPKTSTMAIRISASISTSPSSASLEHRRHPSAPPVGHRGTILAQRPLDGFDPHAHQWTAREVHLRVAPQPAPQRESRRHLREVAHDLGDVLDRSHAHHSHEVIDVVEVRVERAARHPGGPDDIVDPKSLDSPDRRSGRSRPRGWIGALACPDGQRQLRGRGLGRRSSCASGLRRRIGAVGLARRGWTFTPGSGPNSARCTTSARATSTRSRP